MAQRRRLAHHVETDRCSAREPRPICRLAYQLRFLATGCCHEHRGLSPGYDTLPVRILTLMANGAPSLIAALCIVLIAITIVPLGAAGLWLKLGTNRQ